MNHALKISVAMEPEEKTPTLEEVRSVPVEKSRAGHTEAVRGLLAKHGADKLFEDTHEPIIDQETFDNAQRIRGQVIRYPERTGRP